MPWAHDDPQPLEQKVELLLRFRSEFESGQDFVYGIFPTDESEVVGGTGLHTRVGRGKLEIGYWIRESRTGQGLATEASAALTRVAFELCGVERVEVHTDPANERSIAIPRKLGFVQEPELHRSRRRPELEALVFFLTDEAFPQSPAASAQLEAYDAIGTRLL